jgi:hypothetical protein
VSHAGELVAAVDIQAHDLAAERIAAAHVGWQPRHAGRNVVRQVRILHGHLRQHADQLAEPVYTPRLQRGRGDGAADNFGRRARVQDDRITERPGGSLRDPSALRFVRIGQRDRHRGDRRADQAAPGRCLRCRQTVTDGPGSELGQQQRKTAVVAVRSRVGKGTQEVPERVQTSRVPTCAEASGQQERQRLQVVSACRRGLQHHQGCLQRSDRARSAPLSIS